MLYRTYGSTGKVVSAIGFGGMRFRDIEDRDGCIETMLAAAEGGITYFDTAPKYFGTKGEEVFGEGLAEMRRRGLPYYLATKTFESTEDGVRREVEAQLTRLQVDHIDFYHVWCITSLGNWRERKYNGVIRAFQKLKDEGLIGHICVSSHLVRDEIRELLMEDVFEGVLFGYSAYNFQIRSQAFEAIRARNIGCAVMNPLGGGIIPGNPELFQFLKLDQDETVVEAALRFLLSHRDITVSLVGFSNPAEIREALSAVDGYNDVRASYLSTIMDQAEDSFDGLCTGCGYCDDCPEQIPIPQLMDAYNYQILLGDENRVKNRLKYHWDLDPAVAGACIECGQCETACTQHLPIISRLAELNEKAPAWSING